MFEQLDESQEKPNEAKETDWSGTIAGVAVLPVIFVFNHFGKFDMGLNVGICLAVNILVIRFRWGLRRHFWFWATMVSVVAAELCLVYRIKWPQHWVPGVSLLPIGLAGLLIAFGAIGFVEKFIVREPEDEG